MDEEEEHGEEEEMAETGIDSQVRIDSIVGVPLLPSHYIECFVLPGKSRSSPLPGPDRIVLWKPQFRAMPCPNLECRRS